MKTILALVFLVIMSPWTSAGFAGREEAGREVAGCVVEGARVVPSRVVLPSRIVVASSRV